MEIPDFVDKSNSFDVTAYMNFKNDEKIRKIEPNCFWEQSTPK